MWDDIEGRVYIDFYGHVVFELSRGLHMIAIAIDPIELELCPKIYGWTLDKMTWRLAQE